MFVTVLFGDGRMEMLNLNCKLVNFIHHLKEKCGLDFKGSYRRRGRTESSRNRRQIKKQKRVKDEEPMKKCFSPPNRQLLNLPSVERVELMDSGGRVMNLEPLQHSGAPASSALAARRLYVLLRVCQGNEESGGRKYVSLLNNTKSHPEFTELLKKLSNPNQETERKVRRLRTQGSKNISSTVRNNKS